MRISSNGSNSIRKPHIWHWKAPDSDITDTGILDHVILAYDNNLPVGYGALTRISDSQVEIKRLFVRQDFRKQTIGGLLVEELIKAARSAAYDEIFMEISEVPSDALKLCKRSGFWKTRNYGPYLNMPEALCMGRTLSPESITYYLGKMPHKSQIADLFHSVNWKSGDYPDLLAAGLRGAGTVICAFHGDNLIGLVEALDDGAAVAYVHYLLVHPDYQSQHIGTRLMELVKEIYADYIALMVISESPASMPFYKSLGFTAPEQATPLCITRF